jgi:hypothetical protein
MIKVLRKGTKRKIECENCGALLQYEEEDIQDNGYCEYIICPECKCRIALRGTDNEL